ncbi:protein regulator of cytokinesis 1-like isoform X4 [Amblyomma americanum]
MPEWRAAMAGPRTSAKQLAPRDVATHVRPSTPCAPLLNMVLTRLSSLLSSPSICLGLSFDSLRGGKTTVEDQRCNVKRHGLRKQAILECGTAGDFSDRRLEELEEELRRLKEFHAKNKPILMKVERREALWARFLEFEKRAADPFRLSNRGGSLLLEMRERKRLEAELPRLEEEIKTHISGHTGVEDEQFFTEWAEDFLKHLSSQHEAYNLEKDRERQERTPR